LRRRDEHFDSAAAVEDSKCCRARRALVNHILHAIEDIRYPAAAPCEAAENHCDAMGEVASLEIRHGLHDLIAPIAPDGHRDGLQALVRHRSRGIVLLLLRLRLLGVLLLLLLLLRGLLLLLLLLLLRGLLLLRLWLRRLVLLLGRRALGVLVRIGGGHRMHRVRLLALLGIHILLLGVLLRVSGRSAIGGGLALLGGGRLLRKLFHCEYISCGVVSVSISR
jgi:hypothetical protein